MRTYTRKRPDYQEIENVHRLCRLCLSESFDAVPIFTEDSANVCAALALRIMICIGLDIKRDDTLPNKICLECCQELDRYYSFRKRCEATYQKLKSHAIAFKERQYKAQLKCHEKDEGNDENLEYSVKFEPEDPPQVNIVAINGVAQHDINEKLPDKNNDSEEDDSELNISTFLTTMLIQIGIFTPEENGLVVTDESIQTIQLETGDGDLITMRLCEEDEEVDIELIDSGTPQDMESLSTANVELMDTSQVLASPLSTADELKVAPEIVESPQIDTEIKSEESGFVIKYITSKYGPPKRKTKQGAEGNKKTTSGRGTWCSECGKRLASRGALARHRRVHSGEKPFACRDCGRAFAQREVMLRHRTLHTNDRPYKCSSCDKGFTQRGALVAHERAHAPPHERALALHRCAQCPKVFLHASGLSRHMTGHNGRVYVCGACSRQFRDKSSLLRHMRNTNHALDATDAAPTAPSATATT